MNFRIWTAFLSLVALHEYNVSWYFFKKVEVFVVDCQLIYAAKRDLTSYDNRKGFFLLRLPPEI